MSWDQRWAAATVRNALARMIQQIPQAPPPLRLQVWERDFSKLVKPDDIKSIIKFAIDYRQLPACVSTILCVDYQLR